MSPKRHHIVELTRILKELAAEGLEIQRGHVERLSPYITRHIKRFGEYALDVSCVPASLEGKYALPETLFKLGTPSTAKG